MNITILGCSHSAGAETPDEDLFENYWDFLLNKMHPSWKINNYAVSGTGIDFIQKNYNYDWNMDNRELNDRNILCPEYKKNIQNCDLLLWQLTDEPRYTVVTNEQHSFNCVNVSFIRNNLSSDAKNTPMWKQTIIQDYYENLLNERCFFNEKMNFLKMVLLERISKGKLSIVFTMFGQTREHIFTQLDHELVKWYGMGADRGVMDIVEKRHRLDNNMMLGRLGHPSKFAQKHVAKFLNEKILQDS